MQKDVSIIIVNYNTKDLTALCINSVFEKTLGLSFEVILVDNSSKDGSRELFNKDNRIIYIYSEENLGFGRANNLGLKIAQGRNVLFLNPDTILFNNAAKILSNFLDENQSVGACGGNLVDEEMRPALSFKRIFPGLMWECNNLLFHLPEKLYYGKSWFYNHTIDELDVAYISGADLMVRKDILDKVGSFSPDFFMYYEETDLCFRISRAGYKIKSIPSANIQHLEGKSFQPSVVNIKRIEVSEIGRSIFYKKNYTVRYTNLANLVYKIALFFHQLIFKMLGQATKAETCRIRRQILSQIF